MLVFVSETKSEYSICSELWLKEAQKVLQIVLQRLDGTDQSDRLEISASDDDHVAESSELRLLL